MSEWEMVYSEGWVEWPENAKLVWLKVNVEGLSLTADSPTEDYDGDIQQQADLSFAQWEKSNPQLAQQLKQQQNSQQASSPQLKQQDSQQASSPQLKPGQVITTIKSLEHLLAEFQKISAYFQPVSPAYQKNSLPPGLKFAVQQYEVMLQNTSARRREEFSKGRLNGRNCFSRKLIPGSLTAGRLTAEDNLRLCHPSLRERDDVQGW